MKKIPNMIRDKQKSTLFWRQKACWRQAGFVQTTASISIYLRTWAQTDLSHVRDPTPPPIHLSASANVPILLSNYSPMISIKRVHWRDELGRVCVCVSVGWQARLGLIQ